MKRRERVSAGESREQGFSMLELLVTTTLLSIALLGIGRVAIAVIKGNLASERVTTATVLAQDALEQLKSPAAVSNNYTNVIEDYNTMPGYPAFKRVRNVEANNPVSGLQRITVTVFWQADSRSVSLQTIR